MPPAIGLVRFYQILFSLLLDVYYQSSTDVLLFRVNQVEKGNNKNSNNKVRKLGEFDDVAEFVFSLQLSRSLQHSIVLVLP